MLKLKVGEFYMIHLEVSSDILSSDKYFIGNVKKIIQNASDLNDSIKAHLDVMNRSWNAWGRTTNNMEEANKLYSNEERNIESIKQLWLNEMKNKNGYCTVYVQWYEKRCPNNSAKKSSDLPWHGPWYPHLITKAYPWYGLVGHESIIANVRMSKAGGKGFLKISKHEQERLKSRPTRGKHFLDMEGNVKASPGPGHRNDMAVPKRKRKVQKHSESSEHESSAAMSESLPLASKQGICF